MCFFYSFLIMESSDGLPRGCCGDTLVNFGLLQVPDDFLFNMADSSLWYTIVMVFGEPYFKSIIGVQENRNEVFSWLLGRKLAFVTYVFMSYTYSVWVFVFFSSIVDSQPHFLNLRKNEVLIIGYLFLMAGLSMKIYTYITTPVNTIMGAHYFRIKNAPRPTDPLTDDPYYHPLGTASVMCYFGFSMIQASVAGLLLTAILGIAYYTAFHFERYLICKTSDCRQHLKQDIHYNKIFSQHRGRRLS